MAVHRNAMKETPGYTTQKSNTYPIMIMILSSSLILSSRVYSSILACFSMNDLFGISEDVKPRSPILFSRPFCSDLRDHHIFAYGTPISTMLMAQRDAKAVYSECCRNPMQSSCGQPIVKRWTNPMYTKELYELIAWKKNSLKIKESANSRSVLGFSSCTKALPTFPQITLKT